MWHFPHKVASGVTEGMVKLLLNSKEKTTAVLLWVLPVEREAILLERSGLTPVVVRQKIQAPTATLSTGKLPYYWPQSCRPASLPVRLPALLPALSPSPDSGLMASNPAGGQRGPVAPSPHWPAHSFLFPIGVPYRTAQCFQSSLPDPLESCRTLHLHMDHFTSSLLAVLYIDHLEPAQSICMSDLSPLFNLVP